ncbi:MAG TPA: ribosome small subunit-dependent GTPase A [Desulfobacteraceae bacterium]|nr:ribosome small subunit-dependent GTPase A [Desulfobacteraceae bacterium]
MNIDKKADKTETNNPLSQLGWNTHFQAQMERFPGQDLIPARVIGVRKNSFLVSTHKEEWRCALAGRFHKDTAAQYPVTGDWVLVKDTVISRVLVRQNALSRGASGNRGKQGAHPQREQTLAANLDTVFIVSGLDRDFNLRRIERYLTLVYNCGLNPVILLTKADLHQNPVQFVSDTQGVAFGVPVYHMSATDDDCLSAMAPYLVPGATTTMIGSSGAGKSTLINRLCGRAVQRTGAVSQVVNKGTHTTTSRDLIRLPNGGLVIDNPGIREIAFWDIDGGIDAAFPEIEAFARGCRFTDCSHIHEPGCRVREAVEAGDIPECRMENYRKMNRELAYLAQSRNKSADRVEKERWKDVALKIKAMKKGR